MGQPSLIGDIGATNARFALADPPGYRDVRILRCADFATFEEAVEAYLAAIGCPRPRLAAIAIAGPVAPDGSVRMTNHAWTLEQGHACRRLGLKSLGVVNDFVAAALGVPLLRSADLAKVGRGRPTDGHPIAVIGPGSGLGVATLAWTDHGWRVLPGEGGHVSAAADTDREGAVVAVLRRRFGHVSSERVASGSGLVFLHEALQEIDEEPRTARTPAEIVAAARGGSCPTCVETVGTFLAFVGSAAGNLALTVGAHGGVFVAGGVVPRVLDLVEGSAFRRRFEGKGRLSGFLEAIPTYVVTHELPAFLGLTAMLREPEPA